MVDQRQAHVIEEQVKRVAELYDDVNYDRVNRTILMPYTLNAKYKGCQIVEDYSLRIVLNEGYPYVLPSVYEESGKICEEFEHRYSDGSLCVGVPGELLMASSGVIELADYIDGPVKSCLYSAAFFEAYGRYPYGERSHGATGILEYYGELFGIKLGPAVIELMRAVVHGGYHGSDKCPCGSGKQLWSCHGDSFRRIEENHGQMAVSDDLRRVELAIDSLSKRNACKAIVKSSTRGLWG